MHTECVLIAAYFGLLFSDAMRIKLNQFRVGMGPWWQIACAELD